MKNHNTIFFIFIFYLNFNFANNTVIVELKKIGLKVNVPENFIRVPNDQVATHKRDIEKSSTVCEGTKQAFSKALSNPNFEILLNTLDYNETIIVVKFPKSDIDNRIIAKLQDIVKENCVGLENYNIEFLNSAEGKSPLGNYFSTLAKVQSDDGNYFSENFFISSSKATYLLTSSTSKIVSNYELICSLSEFEYEEKDEFLERYKYFHNRKDYVQGILVLNEAIRTNPNNYKYYFLRATLLNQSKKYDAALMDVNKCLELDKTNINALVVRGLIKNGLKKFDESIEDLTKAKLTYSILILSNKPMESVFGLSYMSFLLALNYDAKGDYSMTLKNVNEAINSDQNDPDYYYFRGSIYAKKEDFSKAITDFSKAIDLG